MMLAIASGVRRVGGGVDVCGCIRLHGHRLQLLAKLEEGVATKMPSLTAGAAFRLPSLLLGCA